MGQTFHESKERTKVISEGINNGKKNNHTKHHKAQDEQECIKATN